MRYGDPHIVAAIAVVIVTCDKVYLLGKASTLPNMQYIRYMQASTLFRISHLNKKQTCLSNIAFLAEEYQGPVISGWKQQVGEPRRRPPEKVA